MFAVDITSVRRSICSASALLTPPAFITFGDVVVASSRLVRGAGGVGEVGSGRCGVSLGNGFADVAVGLPV